MFSNNQIISLRQIRRLLILDLFGLSSLLLPSILTGFTGGDGIFCIMVGTLFGGFYLLILKKLIVRMKKQDYYSYMKKTAGQIVADLCMVFYSFFFLMVSAFVMYQLALLIRTWLLPQSSYIGICLLLLALVLYATLRGIEGRARVYEILFWFLAIPLLLMLAFATKDVNVNYWNPIAHTNAKDFIQGSLTVFAFFLPLCLVLFLKPFCKKPDKLYKSAGMALLVVAMVNIAEYLILIGTFQSKTTHILSRPIITLMSMVNFPGGFFARQDALMTAIWFFSLFALVNTGVSYGTHILRDLVSEKRTHFCIIAVLVFVLAVNVWFFLNAAVLEFFYAYMKYIALPVLVILPILLLWIGQIKEKLKDRKEES
ncbi:spore germination protein [Lachnospiraceae bacterium ZAX-1]